MTEFINDDNKEIERRKKDAKRAMYVLMMGSMLISALNIGKQLNAPKQVKSSDTTEAEFRKAWEPINEKNPVNITPMLLHSDSTKTVMMLDEPGGPKCSFDYKGKNKKEVYYNLKFPEFMEVYSVENGVVTRNHEKITPEEAEKVLKEITSYMK